MGNYAAEMDGSMTSLLMRWQAGESNAEQELFALVLPDLRRLAGYFMRRERPNHTLQPTDLLNETYLRLTCVRNPNWQGRRHFFTFAARMMRRYLIDYARNRNASRLEQLQCLSIEISGRTLQLDLAVMVDDMLTQLRSHDSEACTLVELKFFLGLTDHETSDVLDVPLRTVQRRWLETREWLYERITG